MSEYRIVFHHDGSNLDPFYDRFVTEWARRIEEQSNGRIAVDLFHGGQPVRASQILDGVETGEIGAGIAALSSSIDERFSLFELPFVASADESGARTAWEIVQSDFDPEGYDFWVGGMEAGLSCEETLIAFTQSQESISKNIAKLDGGVCVVGERL